jgi:uncharacterized iron-regulated membrane protein
VKQGFRQSMAWLHTWAGLVFGWLLFAIFVTGTSAYFQEEITRWMQPEVIATADPASATQAAVGYLQQRQPNARSWFITPPSARNPSTSLFWVPAEPSKSRRRGANSATLDGAGQPVAARETRGGHFLYRFHYDLHYMPVLWARYLVGIAAMCMLIAILSGIVTHKKIFADFFMLRFGKGQRSWLDAHNVTAVFALPFYLMITYTGLVSLATLYMPWAVTANYASNATFFEEAFPGFKPVEPAGTPAPLVPIAPLVRQAEARFGGAPVGAVSVMAPGDANARIAITRAPSGAIGSRGETIVFSGATGALLDPGATKGVGTATESVMIGLHAGRFAGWGLRWLYFLSGLGGCIMVGSGLVLWTVKRRLKLPDPARPHFGFRLVARLNVAAIAGLPAGIAAYFLANRLLPLDLAGRAQWEIHSLFLVWGGVLAWAIARPEKRAWIEALGLCAALFAAVPLVNALTVPRNGVTGLIAGDWLFVAFDLAMLLLALGFGFAARKAARAKAAAPRRARAAAAAVTA